MLEKVPRGILVTMLLTGCGAGEQVTTPTPDNTPTSKTTSLCDKEQSEEVTVEPKNERILVPATREHPTILTVNSTTPGSNKEVAVNVNAGGEIFNPKSDPNVATVLFSSTDFVLNTGYNRGAWYIGCLRSEISGKAAYDSRVFNVARTAKPTRIIGVEILPDGKKYKQTDFDPAKLPSIPYDQLKNAPVKTFS